MSKTFRIALRWSIPLGFLTIFYFYPLGSIFNTSFQLDQSSLFISIREAIQSESIRGVVSFTFFQATFSTILTLILGLPGAYLFGRFTFPGKSFLRAITGVPFVMPTVVVAAGFNALLGPKGWINIALMSIMKTSEPPIQFMNSLTAILVAHVFYNTTIVLRMVGDFWSHLDPKIDQAASTLGADKWMILRKITLPLLMPVVSAAALLIFIFDFTSFGVVLILGGPQFATLEVEIYYQTISLFNLPLAAILSIFQLCCTLLLTLIYTRITSGLSKPITLRSQHSSQKKLDNWQKRTVAILMIGVLFTFLTSPLIALASRSFVNLESTRDLTGTISRGFSVNFYRALNQNQQESLFYAPPTTAIGISLTYAVTTILLSLLVGTPAAWSLAQEGKSRLNKILDPILMLPLGTSAVTLGLGFIIALAKPPLDLRTSPLLIPIAHTLVASPFVVRSLTPALKSIQPGIRQSAAVLGASPRQVMRYIDIPIIAKALLVAATFAFTISIGEFGATSLISRPEFPTIPIVIYRFLSRPGAMNYGQALALSTILMAVTISGMLAIERFRIAEIGEF